MERLKTDPSIGCRSEYAAAWEEGSGLLAESLEINQEQFRKLFSDSPDLIIREFTISAEKTLQAMIVYLENLVDKNRINEDFLRRLAHDAAKIAVRNCNPSQIGLYLKTQMMTVSPLGSKDTLRTAADSLLSGDTLLLIQGFNEALSLDTKGWPRRELAVPEVEETIRGPRESFVENLGTNIALLRRRVSHPDLTVETLQVGRKTKTQVDIVYLKGSINPDIVAEIRRRVERIKADGVLGAGHLEQWIGDAPLSIFPTLAYSERPDVVAAKILDGRAAIIIDGNPEVLTVPALFSESFWTADDFNSNPFYTVLMRVIRYIAFAISILGPAAYVALSAYHQELIPTQLFVRMAAGVEGAPFPVFIEVIIIGLLFEIFREAGIRLPRPVGPAITIVSMLVVAQSSIAMGLVGVSTVVVVSVTAIASLAIPSQANVSILIRLFLVLLSIILGAYGILLGLMLIMAHALSLRSYGIPYFYPVAPFNHKHFKEDVVLKTPLWDRLSDVYFKWWRK